MSQNLKTVNVSSSQKDQFVDITSDINNILAKSGIDTGICVVYTPHTTAAVTINENADPDVQTDMIMGLSEIVPENLSYDHSEGNSPSHIKSSMIGCSETILIEEGKLVLGTWQGIYFCEFDGPRSRKVYIKFLEG